MQQLGGVLQPQGGLGGGLDPLNQVPQDAGFVAGDLGLQQQQQLPQGGEGMGVGLPQQLPQGGIGDGLGGGLQQQMPIVGQQQQQQQGGMQVNTNYNNT